MASLKEQYGLMEPKSLKDQYGSMAPTNAANYPQTAMARLNERPYGFGDLSVPQSAIKRQRLADVTASLKSPDTLPVVPPQSTGVAQQSLANNNMLPASRLDRKMAFSGPQPVAGDVLRQPPVVNQLQPTIGAPAPKSNLNRLIAESPSGSVSQQPEGDWIANPDSPYWDLTPEGQELLRTKMFAQDLSPLEQKKLEGAISYLQQEQVGKTPPYDPYGKSAGAVINLVGGIVGQPIQDIKGSNQGINTIANFGGEGIKYAGLMSLAGGAGLGSISAGGASGAASGLSRELVSDEPFNPTNIATEALLGAAGEGVFRGVGKLNEMRKLRKPGIEKSFSNKAKEGLIPSPEEIPAPESLTKVYGGKSELGAPGSTRWEGLTKSEKPTQRAELAKQPPKAEPPVVEKPVVPKEGKHPWEMTREASVDRTYPPGKDVPAAPDGATAILNGQPATKDNGLWSYKSNAGPEFNVTDPVTAKRLDHQVMIKNALSEGKPVPPEVLKDYPDLAAQYAKKTPAKPQSVVTEPPKPPVEKAPALEPGKNAIGLNRKEIKRIRSDYGLDNLDRPKKKAWIRSAAEAKENKYDQNALEIADKALATNRLVTDAEHAGMALKATKLVDEYDMAVKDIADLAQKGLTGEVKKATANANGIIDQLDKLTRASEQIGTEHGRGLSIRRMMVNRDKYDLATVTREAQAIKGKRLTPLDNAKIQKAVARNAELEKEVADITAKYEKILGDKEKVLAEREAQRELKKAGITRTSAKGKAKLTQERTDLKKQLAELGFRVNDVSGVSAEGAYLVGRLAVNYIREGASSLKEVTKRVLADIPDLTERDVWKSLNARNPKLQSKAKSAVESQTRVLKSQAKLLTDIDNATKGIFKESTKKAGSPESINQLRSVKRGQIALRKIRTAAYESVSESQRLEKSLDAINRLDDQLTNQYKLLKNGESIPAEDIKLFQSDLKTLRKSMRIDKEQAILDEQLRTGEFIVREKPTPELVPQDLERAQIKLQMTRKKIRNLKADMAPVTGKRVFGEAANTLRTLKATADMSGTLRQGLLLSVTRPALAARTFGQSFQAFFSKYKAEQIDRMIHESPNDWIRAKSKLYLSPLNEGWLPGRPLRRGRLSDREESFMTTWLEKVPVLGKAVEASERQMVSHLNLLRAGVFDDFVAKFPNATRQELEAYANWVNVATGRGNLGSFAGAANGMSLFVFAPRFAASRIQTPYYFLKAMKVPRVRGAVARDMAGLAGVGMTTLALAKMAGYEVGIDPRSPDFGKIKVGNTRIDIWAGFQQPMRFILRAGAAGSDKVGFTGKGLTRNQKRYDPLDAFFRFSSYKLAPSVTFPLELWRGKTMVGEKVTPSESAIRAVIPLVYEDISDAFNDAGFGRAALTTGLGFFGVGVNTYKSKRR